jgi:hypothetical protein
MRPSQKVTPSQCLTDQLFLSAFMNASPPIPSLRFYPELIHRNLSHSARTPRDFRPRVSPPNDRPTFRSRLNAKLEESMSPDQLMALHNQGFLTAHARRVETVQNTFNKDWGDTDRTRSLRYPRVPNHLAPLARPKDGHHLERILREREAARVADEWADDDFRRLQCAKKEPLPLENGAFTQARPRIYYYG